MGFILGEGGGCSCPSFQDAWENMREGGCLAGSKDRPIVEKRLLPQNALLMSFFPFFLPAKNGGEEKKMRGKRNRVDRNCSDGLLPPSLPFGICIMPLEGRRGNSSFSLLPVCFSFSLFISGCSFVGPGPLLLFRPLECRPTRFGGCNP